jgi:hypothetical protein
MTYGATTILLREDLKRDMADIEVYDEAHPNGAGLSEILPQIVPDRWAPPSMRRRRWRVRGDK